MSAVPITAVKKLFKIISIYFFFGCLSIKEIYQKLITVIKLLKNKPKDHNKHQGRSIRSFIKRLHWHCHFIQKIEDDPSIEFKNMHCLYDGLRQENFNNEYFNAWKEGSTTSFFGCMYEIP